MSNTYSQITIHCVFAVKGRENCITKKWRDELHRYIAGTITKNGTKVLAVGGWKDHVHILVGLPVTISIADFMRIIKANSSKWINEQNFVPGKFQWQSGYGAFSLSKSQRDTVVKYIMTQEEHHKTTSFRDEYIKMLADSEISFDEKYIFDFYDDNFDNK
ncbi:MAG: IS200/IS605 family transposase [Chitinophagaceae bacterium]|nr:IS200/IS605 family transposase [Chitinophagaceae bacterium]MBK8951890.1 IS200/IS605 family transposase [Chitinophagaceae bacterium]